MYETTPLKDLQSELGETAQTGLTESEAAARLQKYGRNALAKTKRKSIFIHDDKPCRNHIVLSRPAHPHHGSDRA